jgi:hypothetical protein
LDGLFPGIQNMFLSRSNSRTGVGVTDNARLAQSIVGRELPSAVLHAGRVH